MINLNDSQKELLSQIRHTVSREIWGMGTILQQTQNKDQAILRMAEFLLTFEGEMAMDKKMHKVTKKMEKAEKDIKKGKPKEAIKSLNIAEKKNEKLVKIDKEVRDPEIKKLKKIEKEAKKKK